LAGLHWANPSTPLDANCYVASTVANAPAILKLVPESGGFRRIRWVMLLPTDDPLSLRHAEPAQEPVRTARGTHARH
jgi:hypothetical protein